jgi:hypothetical protein
MNRDESRIASDRKATNRPDQALISLGAGAETKSDDMSVRSHPKPLAARSLYPTPRLLSHKFPCLYPSENHPSELDGELRVNDLPGRIFIVDSVWPRVDFALAKHTPFAIDAPVQIPSAGASGSSGDRRPLGYHATADAMLNHHPMHR